MMEGKNMTKGLLRILPVLILLILFYNQSGFTQSSEELKARKEEIEVLKAIQKELQDIKNLLQTRQAPSPSEPQNVVLNIDHNPFKGNKNAKLTLIEFSDYQCPFCGRYFRDTLPKIETDYIKTGKVKYVFSDFPLESIHQNAFKAAEAAHCAGEQGKYWEMHDRLFNNQATLSPENLPSHAKAIGLDISKFQKCLDSGKYAAEIRKNMKEGQNAGMSGTPTFFLGVTKPNDSNVKVVSKVVGAQPYTNFKQTIDGLLSSGK
jgi:protein-disulfide isomerase